MEIEARLNDFAIRCFRDIGDGDYVSARMAYRAGLTMQYVWASQQAIEKYLKYILLLNRIPAADVKHNLEAGLSKIAGLGNISLDLTSPTKEFIGYIDTYGRFRYLEASFYSFGGDIVKLDRTVWELRRFCTLDQGPRQIKLRDGFPAPKIRIERGHLEKIMDEPKSPAREPLLWQNAFFGKRTRRSVRVRGGFTATNSPLFLSPHILDEVVKYVFLPGEVKTAYREAAKKTTVPSGTAR
jgi:HEPN domain-containing protein